MRKPRVGSRLDVQRREPARKAGEARGGRRRCTVDRCWSSTVIPFAHPLLSRPAENNLTARPQTCRRHPWLCQHAAAALPRRTASRGAGRLGHARVPTYRHENFPAYQSGREFDDALLSSLRCCPNCCRLRLTECESAGFEADDFLAAAAAKEERRGGTVSLRAATATRSSLPRIAPPSCTLSALARWRVLVPQRFARVRRRS